MCKPWILSSFLYYLIFCEINKLWNQLTSTNHENEEEFIATVNCIRVETSTRIESFNEMKLFHRNSITFLSLLLLCLYIVREYFSCEIIWGLNWRIAFSLEFVKSSLWQRFISIARLSCILCYYTYFLHGYLAFSYNGRPVS